MSQTLRPSHECHMLQYKSHHLVFLQRMSYIVSQTVLGCCSIFCALANCCFLATRKKFNSNVTIRVIFVVSLCDFIAFSSWIIQLYAIYCPLTGILIYFGLLSSWVWTCVISFQLWQIGLLKQLTSERNLHIACWSISLLFSIIVLSSRTMFVDIGFCWVWDPVPFGLLVTLPNGSVILWNMFFFGKLIFHFEEVKRIVKSEGYKQYQRALLIMEVCFLIYSIIIVLTWFGGFAGVFGIHLLLLQGVLNALASHETKMQKKLQKWFAHNTKVEHPYHGDILHMNINKTDSTDIEVRRDSD